MANQDQAVSNPTTHLDAVVANLPWGDGFDLGSGVNAVTGEIHPPAVKYSDVKKAETKSSQYSYAFISSESQLDQEIEVSAKGKYNMDGVNLSASAKYLNEIKFSDTSVSMVAHYYVTYAKYDEADSYALTKEAKEIISDHEKFRSLYGDYYVEGKQRGARFTAVYRCETKSASRLDKFKATVGAESPEVFSAEGSAKFKRAAEENDVNIDIKVDMVGYTGDPPVVPQDPEELLKLLKWFIDNEKGVPVRAKLFHYSALDPNFSPEVPITPTIFVALGQLYFMHWRIQDGFTSLPDYYQNQYQEKVTGFEQELSANSNILATDKTTREDITNKATALYGELRDVLDRQDFYFKVAETVGDEPKKDNKTVCTYCGPKAWLYGYSTYSESSAVNIQTITQHCTHPVHVFVWMHTFHVEPDQNKLIVGWEVRANRKDAGEWAKLSDQIILKDSAEVWTQSNFLGPFNWTLHVYYVDAKDYQFG